MLERLLLPQITGLELTDVKYEEGQFIVDAHLASTTAQCPKCQETSQRIHSYYQRRIADLPWAGCPVLLVLQVRRFLCRNSLCKRHIFCERLAPEVAAYARRTTRLHKQVRVLALGMGGEQTARVLPVLGMRGSPATLLHYIRTLPVRTDVKVRIVGLDDWAKRKGQEYGTILIDLERGCVVDLLPDRKTATVVTWLQAHPEIEIISRDRFVNYIEAASQGAPGAIQIADRFHLVKNLHDALRRMLDRHATDLRRAAELVAEQTPVISTPNPTTDQPEQVQADSVPIAPEAMVTPVAPDAGESALLAERFAAVKTLQQQGLSVRTVARQLGMNRRTVSRYFVHTELPVRSLARQNTSSLLPYLDYLWRRRQEGCTTVAQLHQELTALGFKGSYHVVWRAYQHLPQLAAGAETAPLRLLVKPLGARKAAWLLSQVKERLKPEDQQLLDALCQTNVAIATAHHLTQTFQRLVRERCAAELDAWIATTHQANIPELKRFAEGLAQDYQAVKAAMSLPWSNGPVEGQVNKLKTVKRQMYGRGNLDLLRQRLVHAM